MTEILVKDVKLDTSYFRAKKGNSEYVLWGYQVHEKSKVSSFSLYVFDCPLSLSAAADHKMLVYLKCKHNLPLIVLYCIVLLRPR